MKKRIMTILIVAAMIVCMACPAVSACSIGSSNRNYLYDAAVVIVNECNGAVRLMVKAAQLTPYNDVPLLRLSADLLINQTTAAVRALGFDVECTYTSYVVDGQTVLIDPLRVINPLD